MDYRKPLISSAQSIYVKLQPAETAQLYIDVTSRSTMFWRGFDDFVEIIVLISWKWHYLVIDGFDRDAIFNCSIIYQASIWTCKT